jgi:hypothetical protein
MRRGDIMRLRIAGILMIFFITLTLGYAQAAWLPMSDVEIQRLKKVVTDKVVELSEIDNYFPKSSVTTYVDWAMKSLNQNNGKSLLIAHDGLRYSKFTVILDKNKNVRKLTVTRYSKDFGETFKRNKIDQSEWDKMIRQFNTLGYATAVTNGNFKFSYDFKDGDFLIAHTTMIATNCTNKWVNASSQTMNMDSEFLFTLKDYKNKERHFSAIQGPNKLDVYYMKGAVLIKGYSEDQIKKIAQKEYGNVLFMMPMAFAVPTAILAKAAPKGPCNVKAKIPFSIPSLGEMRLQGRKLTNIVGQLYSSSPNEISYEFDASTDPPVPNKTLVRYSGAMSFGPQEESLPDDTDVKGYTVVTRSRPYSVAGSPGVPAKLGELRSFLLIDKRKAQIVSRFYEATYGADSMCKRFSPQESPQVSNAVKRFKEVYPEIMQLVDQSPYLDRARLNFETLMEKMAERASKNPKEAACQEALYILQQSVETKSGRDAVLNSIMEFKK